jgi:hypothetical protein
MSNTLTVSDVKYRANFSPLDKTEVLVFGFLVYIQGRVIKVKNSMGLGERKEYENIFPFSFFKPLNINTLLITTAIRIGSTFADLSTIAEKKYWRIGRKNSIVKVKQNPLNFTDQHQPFRKKYTPLR